MATNGQPASALIGVVEDEEDLCTLLRHNLERQGYRVWIEHDERGAMRHIQSDRPDVLLLDLMLPGVSGMAVLVELRRDARSKSIPVIVVTAKRQEPDELVGFALGADDYIGKPFSMDVLLARIQAVLRRTRATPESREPLSRGPFVLNVERNQLTVDGEAVFVTHTELRLLQAIIAADGRVVRRDRLIEQLFNTTDPTDRRIDVHMTNLRRKLGGGAGWIETIRGVGYACREPGGTGNGADSGFAS